MKKLIYTLTTLLTLSNLANAQESVYPAKDYKGLSFITNGTIHVGNGTVIENATIKINNGKIVEIGTNIAIPADDAQVFNAKGKQVYPGLILASSDVGLKEISNGVRASNDLTELGDFNSDVRSITAYNSDSRVINILKGNGILLASVNPEGGLITGSSSVVQFDAWNWEDASYKMDAGIHLNMPSFIVRFGRRGGFGGFGAAVPTDPAKIAFDKVEEVKNFFREAKAYNQESNHANTNLKLAATKGLFERKQNFLFMLIRLNKCWLLLTL